VVSRTATRPRKRFEYDVVLSFAGEDRKHAKKVATLLEKQDISVFYDEFKQYELWGKELYEYLDNIYSNKARFCIMFLSEHYAKKLWTNHERKSAQARAFTDNREYILPVRIDDTKIPGIRSTQGFLDLRKHSYQDVVAGVAHKLGRSTEQHKPKVRTSRKPALVKPVVDPHIPIHKIRKEFTQEEKDKFLGSAFAIIKRYFQRGMRAYKVADKDVTGEVTTVDVNQFVCTIYVRGVQRIQCRIWVSDSYHSKGIFYSEAKSTLFNTNSYNHSLHVADDGYEIYLQGLNLNYFQGQGRDNRIAPKDAAVSLWKAFIEPLSR
jgi:hypothetical protein